MKKRKITLCIILALAFLTALFAGCSGGSETTQAPGEQTTQSPESAPPSTESSGAAETAAPEESDAQFYSFPITEEMTITMFTSIEASIAPYISDYNDTSLIRGWSEATGVTIDVTAVAADAAKELFNVMMSGDEMCDVIVQGGAWYPGGASAAVAEDAFLNLIDYTDYMPNYLDAIEKYGFENNVMTEDVISGFWQINANNFPVAGIVTRGDLLEEVGMNHDDITTFDDWTEMLRALKTEAGVKAPLALSVIGDMGTGVVLSGGFNTSVRYQNGSYVNLPLYVVDDEIHFGFLEDSYERYVDLISGWYKEGLINDNIANMEGGPYAEEYVLRGENAVFVTMYANMPQYAEQLGDGAWFTPLYYPMENEGDVFHFSDTDEVALESEVWNINKDASNKELVIQMIDWFYTEEGCRLASYGIEGEAYNIVDGEIVLTDLILHNPDGLTPSNAMNIYAGDLVPTIKDTKRLMSTYDDEVIAAIDWISQQETDSAYNLPSGLSSNMTEEEQEIYNTYSPDLLAYMSENSLAFLTGQKDISEIPTFQETLYELGIQNIIDIYQSAYNRMMGLE